MRLDLADLRLFIAIVDTGSITGGAANAHLARRPPVRLRKMEAEIGVPLLHRHARGVTMTEAGRYWRAMPARFLRSSSVCAVRCTPSPAVSGDAAPVRQHLGDVGLSAGKLAARWQRTRRCRSKPKNAPARISSAVSGGRGAGRSGVRCGRPRAAALDPVADDPLVLIVPPARPLAEKQEVAFAAVLNEPLVALYQTSALQQHIEQHAAELGRAKRSGQDEPFCRALRDGGARRRRGDPAARYCRALPAALFVCRHRVTGPLGAAPFVPVLSG